ncbi:MAG: fructose-bisphosphate aldolase [Candidatus Roseilinea sp.]|nr:MAG: fructose-bisphosphate aldolase [Candidatus Roseilinea sp.]
MTIRRLRRLFPDGKTLIVACDHGMIDGPAAGIEVIGDTIEAVIAGGADGIMCSFGVATRFAEALARIGLVLRLDGAGTRLGLKAGPGAQFYAVEDALRLGADAVCVTAFPGSPHEATTLETLARVVRQAHAWDMPVMAEIVPGGFDSPPEKRTLDAIKVSARVAAELGADWVKLPYVEGFAEVVRTCFVPVVVLGGRKQDDPRETLTMLRASLDAGGVGGVIGRNVWQSGNTERMTRAMAGIVHAGASVEDALQIALA